MLALSLTWFLLRGFVRAAAFKKIFGEDTCHGGWMSKKAGIRPLFQRHYFELIGVFLLSPQPMSVVHTLHLESPG